MGAWRRADNNGVKLLPEEILVALRSQFDAGISGLKVIESGLLQVGNGNQLRFRYFDKISDKIRPPVAATNCAYS